MNPHVRALICGIVFFFASLVVGLILSAALYPLYLTAITGVIGTAALMLIVIFLLTTYVIGWVIILIVENIK